MQDWSDADLDAYILARLRHAGVSLDVLPQDDPEAPADRRRILESARRFLRTTPPVIRGFPIDPQEVPPVLYPGTGRAWRSEDGQDG